MRSSSLAVLGVLGGVVLSACSVSTTPNSITFKSKPEFVDSSQPAKTSTKDWNGEAIKISNNGVNPLTGDGGVVVVADPNATKITASAIFAARADTEAEAQESIRDAIGTLQINEAGGSFEVSCGNGEEHGSSDKAASGCKLLTVTIPAGSAQAPLDLTVGNGSGDITFKSAVTASNLLVDNNGLGVVDVKVQHVKGSKIVVTGEHEVSVALPADFAADQVILNAGDDPEAGQARILTSDFDGMESGKAYGTDMTNAAAELNVQSKGPFDDDTVTIKKL